MMTGRVGDVKMPPVAVSHFCHYAQALEQVQRTVDRSDVHVWVGFLSRLKDLIHAHVAVAGGTFAGGNYRQHYQTLGRKPVTFETQGLDGFFMLNHKSPPCL